MTLFIDRDDDGAVLVRGEVDLDSADDLERAVLEAPTDGRVVVDLRDVTFMDSTGLRALVRLARACEPARFVLRDPSPRVERLLAIVGMDDGHGQWDVERTRPPGDGPGAWSRYAATLEGSRGAMGFARTVAIRSRKTLVGSRGASRAAVARTRARIDESRRCVDVSRAALRRSMGIARSA